MDEQRDVPNWPGYYWCRDPRTTDQKWTIVYLHRSLDAISDVAEFDLDGGVPQLHPEVRKILSRFEWDGPLAEPGEGEPF